MNDSLSGRWNVALVTDYMEARQQHRGLRCILQRIGFLEAAASKLELKQALNNPERIQVLTHKIVNICNTLRKSGDKIADELPDRIEQVFMFKKILCLQH